jgi:hypothetical protein
MPSGSTLVSLPQSVSNDLILSNQRAIRFTFQGIGSLGEMTGQVIVLPTPLTGDDSQPEFVEATTADALRFSFGHRKQAPGYGAMAKTVSLRSISRLSHCGSQRPATPYLGSTIRRRRH